MKHFTRFLALLLICACCLTLPAIAAGQSESMRGVWVSSVYNLDYPSKSTTDPAVLKAEADAILDNCVKWGLNAVFLQVRPSADALYPSKFFPWSKYLTGIQGTAPADGFDPLAYWVQAAHQRGLELHAWINPYRITKGKDAEWQSLTKDHPAKQHPDWVVQYTDGNYYFNPALPEVRNLVTQSAVEIAKNYDVDGIHMDDYFYPGTDFDDTASFAQSGASNLADWRRENVNALVAQLDKELHAVRSDIQFGISPSGIWANKSSDPRGSQTSGSQHYMVNYADSLRWIENGWIDYIIPQIYWEIGHKAADFATLADWWNDAVAGSDVKLYIGMGAYRAADNPTGVWQTPAPLFESLAYLQTTPNVSGEVFFRYGSFLSVPSMAAELTKRYQTEPVSPTPEETPEKPIASGSFSEIMGQFLLSMIQ